MMVDDILQLAHNQQFLERITNGMQGGGNIELLKKLPKYEDLKSLEARLKAENKLNFNSVFHEPVGNYLIRTYLVTEHSVDKAVFVSDVELFKKLNDASGRRRVAEKIYYQFLAPETEEHIEGVSVFSNPDDEMPWYAHRKSTMNLSHLGNTQHSNIVPADSTHGAGGAQSALNALNPPDSEANGAGNNTVQTATMSNDDGSIMRSLSLLTEGTNSIGVYGKPILIVKEKIELVPTHNSQNSNHLNTTKNDSNESNNNSKSSNNSNNKSNNRGKNGDKGDAGNYGIDNSLFDAILQEVLDDLRLDVFPRFCRSHYYRTYIRCKALEDKKVTIRDFLALRPLGRGAFGLVHACEKRDCGRLYAMKQINKRRVQATESLKTVMQERDYLAQMNSEFVTSLKYAIHDEDTIYIILDLMLGGDLKYHLNVQEKFPEDRARFHSAQVLLGLEHIHSKGIVYRDLKLENVLVDENGHVKISDLGLAVSVGTGGSVRGYAGTPGYTAPEVVLGFQYDHIADFFSLGVMVYRCLCGKKPFQRKTHRNKHQDKHRQSSQLDRNVIEMEPEFSPQYFTAPARSILKGLMAKKPLTRLGTHGIHEIKQHPWFEKIDFGLLEAGYLKPPFEPPKLDQVHSPIQGGDGAPPQDKQYAEVKITSEFEKQLEHFQFISPATLQDELVEVLRRADIDKKKNRGDGEGLNDTSENYDPLAPDRNTRCFGCNTM